MELKKNKIIIKLNSSHNVRKEDRTYNFELLQISAVNKHSYRLVEMGTGVRHGNVDKSSIKEKIEQLGYSTTYYTIENEENIKDLILKQHSSKLAGSLKKLIEGYGWTNQERKVAAKLLFEFSDEEYKEENNNG